MNPPKYFQKPDQKSFEKKDNCNKGVFERENFNTEEINSVKNIAASTDDSESQNQSQSQTLNRNENTTSEHTHLPVTHHDKFQRFEDKIKGIETQEKPYINYGPSKIESGIHGSKCSLLLYTDDSDNLNAFRAS